MVILKVTQAKLPQQEAASSFRELLDNPPENFELLIQPLRNLQTNILKIKTATLSSKQQPSLPKYYSRHIDMEGFTQGVEIFTDSKALYVVSLERERAPQRFRSTPPSEENEENVILKFSYIGPSADFGNFHKMLGYLKQVFNINFEPYHPVYSRFGELKNGRDSPTSISPEELKYAFVLADKPTRRLAIAIKASGGLLVRDLAKQVPGEDRQHIDQMRRNLLETGIVESEIVVVCRKTQAQIARVPSQQDLQNLAGSVLRCSCGRPIVEEKAEEALTITPLGRELLDKSRWLTNLVLVELERVGVPLDRMLIEIQEGGDELDLIAEVW